MRTVHIETSTPYDVCIGEALLPQTGSLLKNVLSPRRAAIITDSTVNVLYGAAVEDSLRTAGFEPLRFSFPAGEQHKRLSTLEEILEYLGENHVTRTDVVVALGGGVPGDMAGFASAVYARGMRFIQIPTTLLAAVDASVGGKTAVDLRAGKNLAGCFHQPSLVVTDTSILRALPAELLSDGAAEIIKYGILADPELFDWMCQPNWTDRIDEIVARSVTIKRDFVEADERDTGARQQLNLGHTFGHAIEKHSNFTLSHGQCVAIGMAIAAGAANVPEVCRAILKANCACGLPMRSPYSAHALATAALADKKRQGNRITLVLPERIGKCRLEMIDVEHLELFFQRGIEMVEALTK